MENTLAIASIKKELVENALHTISSDKSDLEQAMSVHVVGFGILTGSAKIFH